MSTLSTTAALLAHSLSWALLYSLWQGLLIYGITFVAFRALPDINARVKYNLSYCALAVLFFWFADTWFSQYLQLKGTTIYITQAAAATGATTTLPLNVAASADHSLLHRYLTHIDAWVPFIVLLYTIGLGIMLFRFLINIAKLRPLRSRGILSCHQQLTDFTRHWQQHMCITRKVQVFLSAHVSVPMMLGVLRPVILLPVATLSRLTADQVEAILLHELAHIKRHDYLLNIFQTIAETILFFNPFIWLLSAMVRNEREHCCDDMVISCSSSPLPYAKALAILEHDRVNDNSLALAANGHKNELLNRIKRIMEMKKSNMNYSQLTIIVVAIIAITFSIAMFTFTPSYAQKGKGKRVDTTTANQKTISNTRTVIVNDNGNKKVVNATTTTTNNEETEDIDENSNINIDISVSDDNGNKNISKNISVNGADISKVMQEIMSTASKGVSEALASVDYKQIGIDIVDATKEIDAVNWDEINQEIHNALKEVNKELNSGQLQRQISKETRKGLEESRRALEEAKKEMARSKMEMAHARANVISENAKARAAERKALAEERKAEHMNAQAGSQDYETMLNSMEKDGLLNRASKYRVEKDGNELFINGVRQSDNTYLKYKTYLKDNNVVIKGNKGTLSVTATDTN